MDPAVFRLPDNEKKNVDSTNVVPNAIKQLPPLDPDSPSLTEEQLKVAKSDLLKKDFIKLEYPRKMKFGIDPQIPTQRYALFSFIPAKGASPDSQGCYGALKLRGNFTSEMEADKWCDKLMRDYDSYSEIDMTYVGMYVPLMNNNEMYTRTTREIDIKKTVDDTVKSAANEKRLKEEQELKDIHERQNKLLNASTEEQKEKSYTDLEYYIELRVKKASALATIDDCQKREKEAQGVADATDPEIQKLEEQFPEYKEKYLEQYKNALKTVGADITKNPIINFMGK